MFGAMFWLIRYPFAEACGKKPAVASPCMERMARWSAAAALIFRLCSRARFTAWSMVIGAFDTRQGFPAGRRRRQAASATISQTPSINASQSKSASGGNAYM